MALTYVRQKQNDHLALIFQGTFDPSVIPTFMEAIITACKTEKPFKMLVDCRQVIGDLEMLDRFQLGQGFAQKFIETLTSHGIPHCRFAVLGNPPLIHPTGFASTVASNRGVDCRSFTDPKEAFTWLEVDPTSL